MKIQGNALISIIIPVYGVEAYLDQCIASLVNQTHENIEIILVDDGSKDNCPRIIDEWAQKDSRIVPIHKTNGGQSSARNVGLDVAKGEYITFVDSDDWIEAEYCEKLLHAMELFDAQIGVASFSRVYTSRRVNVPFFINGENTFYPCVPNQAVKYFLESSIAIWGKMYRADILRDIRLPEGRLAEEYAFQLSALRRTSVVGFCNMHLYDYRIRGDSDAHSIKPKYLLDNISAIDEAYHICAEYFQFEKNYCKGHLAALIYEFCSSKEYGSDMVNKYPQVLKHAIDTVGGFENLLKTMNEPENILFYTYCQFGQYMNKAEKKKVQTDYRHAFTWRLLPQYKVRFFLKYLPAAISIGLTSRVINGKNW